MMRVLYFLSGLLIAGGFVIGTIFVLSELVVKMLLS